MRLDRANEAKKNKADEKTIKDLDEKAAAIHDQFDPFRKRLQVIDVNYFTDHPTSYLTAYGTCFFIPMPFR